MLKKFLLFLELYSSRNFFLNLSFFEELKKVAGFIIK